MKPVLLFNFYGAVSRWKSHVLINIVSESHPEKSLLHPLDLPPDSSLIGLERPVLGVEHPQLLLALLFLALLPRPVEFAPFGVRFGNLLAPGTSHSGVHGLSAMCLAGWEPGCQDRSLLDDTLGPRRDGCHLDDERNISVGVDAVSTDHTSVSVDRDAERRADRCWQVVGEGLWQRRWWNEVVVHDEKVHWLDIWSILEGFFLGTVMSWHHTWDVF